MKELKLDEQQVTKLFTTVKFEVEASKDGKYFLLLNTAEIDGGRIYIGATKDGKKAYGMITPEGWVRPADTTNYGALSDSDMGVDKKGTEKIPFT